MNNSCMKQCFTQLASFGTFCLCTFLVKVIFHKNQCCESCNLSYILVVHPVCMTNGKFQCFVFFTFDTSQSFQWLPLPSLLSHTHLLVSFMGYPWIISLKWYTLLIRPMTLEGEGSNYCFSFTQLVGQKR